MIPSCNQEVQLPFEVVNHSAVNKIDQGDFSAARTFIRTQLAENTGLTDDQRKGLEFELLRMDRIELDFRATEEQVLEFIREYYPEVTPDDMLRWEQSRALEVMTIDGTKRYFNRAARNLFRIDREMKEVWAAAHPRKVTAGSGETSALDQLNMKIMDDAAESGELYVQPVRLKIMQAVDVDADVVPAGETIRCWIPFPREIPGRQEDIRLTGSSPEDHQLAPPDALQRTVYFERTAVAGEQTHFEVSYEYTGHGAYAPVNPENVRDLADPEALADFLKEEPPHILFSDTLRKLSAEIIGQETNPYVKAQKLFDWIDGNIPWASAREYSSIRNIPEYAIRNRHGDCGIQALTFITLCRLNGIPARWQSGWEFEPPDNSMHDWGMIYFEPFGWLPMDVTYGLRKTDDPEFRHFYLSGMDSYRLIFNDAYSKEFFPPKTHPRSETVDSQRGEVEWSGSNLYFDQWDWTFRWELLED